MQIQVLDRVTEIYTQVHMFHVKKEGGIALKKAPVFFFFSTNGHNQERKIKSTPLYWSNATTSHTEATITELMWFPA